MSDEREIRKQIAAEAQVAESAVAASPLVRAFQFFLVPLLIVGACVLVYVAFGFLLGSPKNAHEWLKDVKEGGANTRPHAALQLAQALRRQEVPDATLAPQVMEVYRHARPEELLLRGYLINCLGYLRDPRASELLLDVARADPEMTLRTLALDALGTVKDPSTLPELVKFLDDSEGVIRKYAAFNVAAVAEKAGDRGVVEPLKKMLSDPRSDVGWNAAFALAYFLGDPSGTDTLKKMLDRKYLAEAIGRDPNAEALIVHALYSACNAAAKLKDPGFLPPLDHLARNERDATVRHVAQKAVAILGAK